MIKACHPSQEKRGVLSLEAVSLGGLQELSTEDSLPTGPKAADQSPGEFLRFVSHSPEKPRETRRKKRRFGGRTAIPICGPILLKRLETTKHLIMIHSKYAL